MRRLPVYFLIDVSESMVGEPIEQVQNGMRDIIQELRTDPYALETVFISIIVFAGKVETVIPLTELTRFYPPVFPVGSGTSLGKGLDFLASEMETSVQKTTPEVKGDWKPIVFLFTDGTPTDDPSAAIARWNSKSRSRCSLVAVSLGNNADTKLLGRITDNVLRLNDTDEYSFRSFFKWITASIKLSSISVNEQDFDDLKLPAVSSFNLEKIDQTAPYTVDENFVVLSAKCETTGKIYLIKYAKHLSCAFDTKIYGRVVFDESRFKLVGAYPVDASCYERLSEGMGSKQKIDSNLLMGVPACPCCGSQLGMIQCGRCGRISCGGDDGNSFECAWCGVRGTLSYADRIDYSREQG